MVRILLVEDDAMIGEATAVALKDAAYAVDWVRDGATANSILHVGAHQAVLLDLGLPGRDGLEVLRRLRQAGNTVPVLVITARDGVGDREALAREGDALREWVKRDYLLENWLDEWLSAFLR